MNEYRVRFFGTIEWGGENDGRDIVLVYECLLPFVPFVGLDVALQGGGADRIGAVLWDADERVFEVNFEGPVFKGESEEQFNDAVKSYRSLGWKELE